MSLQEAASSGAFKPHAAQGSESPFDPPPPGDGDDQAALESTTPFSNPYVYTPVDEETLVGGGGSDLHAARRRAWSIVGLAIVIPAAVAGIIAWQLFGGGDQAAPTVTRVTTTPPQPVTQEVQAAASTVQPTATAETGTSLSAAATTTAETVTVTTTTDSSAAASEASETAAVATSAAVDLSSLDPAGRLAAWTDIQTIEVLPGETLWLIAQNYDTTISAIVALNNLADPEMLNVGQTLMIPVGFAEEIVAEAMPAAAGGSEATETAGTSTVVDSTPIEAPTAADDLTNWHTIAPVLIEDGDSLAAIAAANNTTVEAIMALNGIADADLIYVGTELLVPVGYQGGTSVASTSDSMETATPASGTAPADTSDDMMEEEPAGGSDDMMSE